VDPPAGLRLLLRFEWVALFLLGIGLYLQSHGNPYWLVPALLAPDLSMVGYLAGPRVGAVTYNLAHNLVVPVLLMFIAWPLQSGVVALAGMVLLAHVGMDRALGYGLKLPTSFQDTHLGRIGRGARG
jgi:hypothetical protein